MLNWLETLTEVRYYNKKYSDKVSKKSNDVTSRDVIFDFDVKNVLTSAKMKGPRHNFIILIKKFYLLSFKQGVNHLHTSTRKKTIVIWKMSDFFDVIVKIWRHDDVTSNLLTSIESLLGTYYSCQVSSF